jgi:Co/Zn/Cd efflux system component
MALDDKRAPLATATRSAEMLLIRDFKSIHCCVREHDHTRNNQQRDKGYRRVLWAVLGINALMFLIEIVAGLSAGSVSVQADALDFLADAGN